MFESWYKFFQSFMVFTCILSFSYYQYSQQKYLLKVKIPCLIYSILNSVKKLVIGLSVLLFLIKKLRFFTSIVACNSRSINLFSIFHSLSRDLYLDWRGCARRTLEVVNTYTFSGTVDFLLNTRRGEDLARSKNAQQNIYNVFIIVKI